jgi:L-rhamnose mutarotase
MQRYGSVIRLKPEKYEKYKILHANVWPEVAAMIEACNIQNYSIYHWNGLLFSYFEYVGNDFEGDMAKMAADPKTREWWAVCDPCQQPVEGNSKSSVEGNWWKNMEELFHQE